MDEVLTLTICLQHDHHYLQGRKLYVGLRCCNIYAAVLVVGIQEWRVMAVP